MKTPRGVRCSVFGVRTPELRVPGSEFRVGLAQTPNTQHRTPNTRRGQTLILALAVLFLLIVVGAIFVGMIARNLSRSQASRRVSRSEALAWAGIRFAAQEFNSSVDGADWTPLPNEDLWRTPQAPPPPNPLPNPPPPTPAEQRLLDPDYPWLSDGGTFNHPYVRYRNGDGRFLLRVTYLPSFRPERPGDTYPTRFDPNSMMVHVEAIGRPGIIEPNDPTTLLSERSNPNWKPGQILGEFRKVEAWAPIGLVDQLLWITNRTNERGPAHLGIPPLLINNPDPAAAQTQPEIATKYDDEPDDGRDNTGTSFYGSIRCDNDLVIHGDTSFNIYPARQERVAVSGTITQQSTGNQAPTVTVVLRRCGANDPDWIDHQEDELKNDFTQNQLEGPSGTQQFNPLALLGFGGQGFYADNQYLQNLNLSATESTRAVTSPDLAQANATTGVSRYAQLTRDSGTSTPATAEGEQRNVNTGWFGYALATNPNTPNRAQPEWKNPPAGLYLDNFGDIQYPDDRKAVVDEWLRNGQADVSRTGWVGQFYVPSVRESGTVHPIAELEFTRAALFAGGPVVDAIRMTRYDVDSRKMNFGPAAGRTRIFYAPQIDATGNFAGNYFPVGPSALFAYPANGVVFCEGSVRVRGTIPEGKQVTVASNGTIYIEGNLLRGNLHLPDVPHSTAALALLAHDYVTLNPTLFTRVQPSDDAVLEADQHSPGEDPSQWHYSIPQSGYMDVSLQNAGLMDGSDGLPAAYLLHLQQTAQAEDSNSHTVVQMRLGPSLNQLAPWPDPLQAVPLSNDPWNYHFFFFPPQFNNYNFSNAQSAPGGTVNYERKSFRLAADGQGIDPAAGAMQFLRFFVPPLNMGGGQGQGVAGSVPPGSQAQPWWVSRIAAIPMNKPLQLEIHAVMYAQTGSWFVIPPPWFNEQPGDTRANFTASGIRVNGTRPAITGSYPFYHEPLNMDIAVYGAITENTTAESADQVTWTKRVWTKVPEVGSPDRQTWDNQTPGFHPRIRYLYEPDLRRIVRYRILATGQEGVAYSAPAKRTYPQIITDPPAGVPTVDELITAAKGNNSYVVTLPLLPKLPASPVLFEGGVVQ